jgi:hypothetical protein
MVSLGAPAANLSTLLTDQAKGSNQITGMASGARVIQFALKLLF